MNKKMLEQFALAGHGGEKNWDMMKAFVLIPANVKSMLKRVAFKENLISTSSSLSFPPSSTSGGQNFSFDLKVKQVTVGRIRKDGWARKVLKMPRCQEKKQALIIPGMVEARKVTIGMATKLSLVPLLSATAHVKTRTRKMALPTSVKKHAKKRRRKRWERKPLRSP